MSRKSKKKVGELIFGKHKINQDRYLEHPFLIVKEEEENFICVQLTSYKPHYFSTDFATLRNNYDDSNNTSIMSGLRDEYSSLYNESIQLRLNSKNDSWHVNYYSKQNLPNLDNKFDFSDSNFGSFLDEKHPIINCGHGYYFLDKQLGFKNNSFLILNKLFIFPKKSLNNQFYYLNTKVNDKVIKYINHKLFMQTDLNEKIDIFCKDLWDKK
ncbi:hypothetical protein [Mycoplasma sp. SG1]|uniref:hypothetical protein n=1 Tax=Mycoplasma sp. SG1 TaxID=2810348 RepID=UPI0020241732|nr:hypothetical protein [Mycoplasma sp. SG1]URM52804.1 hypothetical protein JRW51_00460 [Mycoplasma sp. SG1]